MLNIFDGCTNLKKVNITDLADWCNIDFRQGTVITYVSDQSASYGPAMTSNPLAIGADLYVNGTELKDELVIPNGVTRIGENSFYGYTTLESVTLPDGITSIGKCAFANCSNITSINIPNSITSIASTAFEGCSGLPVIDNIRYADQFLICTVDRSLSSYTIREGTMWIGPQAFDGCANMTSITIPNSVISIGDMAFYECNSLHSITIPNNVTYVGNRAFEKCSALNSVTLPDGLTEIRNSIFFRCKSLTTIDIPNSVTRIGSGAFEKCSALSTFTIPDGVTEIGSEAFSWCTALSSITIPNSVTKIGQYAFENCKSLSTVFIPNSVTTIGYKAFYNVPHIQYYGTATGAPWGALSMNGNNFEIYMEYDDNTQTLTYYYDAQRESRSGVTELYDPNTTRFADYYNKVQKAVIDESMQNAPLTSMEKMFYGGFSMKPLYLSKMTSIEGLANLNTSEVTSMQSMFEGCQSLTELDLSTFNTANVTNMNCMFQSCTNLETLNIALFNIGKMEDMRYMFSGCSKLKTIYCNSNWNGSEAQSGYMFSGCSALEGGQGTKFNSSVIDKTYARTDAPANDKPGYFTVVESVAVTIGATEWATLVAPYALDFSDVDGLTAYIVTGHTGSTVETTEVYDVPANTPVLLNGAANTYTIPLIAGSATDVSGNKLVAGTGANVAAEAGKTKYVLSSSDGKAVFKKINATPATVAKSKAYLMFDEVVEARQLTFGNDATGIEASPEFSLEGKDLWYDLQGRRLEGMPTRKGLYIVNGKKYLVK